MNIENIRFDREILGFRFDRPGGEGLTLSRFEAVVKNHARTVFSSTDLSANELTTVILGKELTKEARYALKPDTYLFELRAYNCEGDEAIAEGELQFALDNEDISRLSASSPTATNGEAKVQTQNQQPSPAEAVALEDQGGETQTLENTKGNNDSMKKKNGKPKCELSGTTLSITTTEVQKSFAVMVKKGEELVGVAEITSPTVIGATLVVKDIHKKINWDPKPASGKYVVVVNGVNNDNETSPDSEPMTLSLTQKHVAEINPEQKEAEEDKTNKVVGTGANENIAPETIPTVLVQGPSNLPEQAAAPDCKYAESMLTIRRGAGEHSYVLQAITKDGESEVQVAEYQFEPDKDLSVLDNVFNELVWKEGHPTTDGKYMLSVFSLGDKGRSISWMSQEILGAFIIEKLTKKTSTAEVDDEANRRSPEILKALNNIGYGLNELLGLAKVGREPWDHRIERIERQMTYYGNQVVYLAEHYADNPEVTKMTTKLRELEEKLEAVREIKRTWLDKHPSVPTESTPSNKIKTGSTVAKSTEIPLQAPQLAPKPAERPVQSETPATGSTDTSAAVVQAINELGQNLGSKIEAGNKELSGQIAAGNAEVSKLGTLVLSSNEQVARTMQEAGQAFRDTAAETARILGQVHAAVSNQPQGRPPVVPPTVPPAVPPTTVVQPAPAQPESWWRRTTGSFMATVVVALVVLALFGLCLVVIFGMFRSGTTPFVSGVSRTSDADRAALAEATMGMNNAHQALEAAADKMNLAKAMTAMPAPVVNVYITNAPAAQERPVVIRQLITQKVVMSGGQPPQFQESSYHGPTFARNYYPPAEQLPQGDFGVRGPYSYPGYYPN